MNSSTAGKGVMIVLVLFLMLGSVGMFLVFSMMSNLFPDDHKVDREYTFEGMLESHECTGFGMSMYKAESEVEHVYFVEYTLESSYGTFKGDFGVVFDRNDRPIDIYTFIRDDKIGDVDVQVWKLTDGDFTYFLYIGKVCKIYQMDVLGPNVEAVGTVVEG